MHNFKQYYDVRTLQYVKPVKQIQTFLGHWIKHEHKDFSIFLRTQHHFVHQMHVNMAKVICKSLVKVTEVYVLCVVLLTLQ